jgi:hypothetical protein
MSGVACTASPPARPPFRARGQLVSKHARDAGSGAIVNRVVPALRRAIRPDTLENQ